ncbi:MAG: AAA family ATPase, partial [Clostridiaceae bacterium]|nr:AAA family ATPase [Clostridiaceae bacterium]
IYYNNEVEINEIINFLESENKDKKENENEKIKKELENLKEILIKNNMFLENDNIKNKEKNIKISKIIKNSNKGKNKKIITIAGTGGVGKSIITINLSNTLKNKNKKISIIDFDILNNSLHTILGVNKYPQKIKNKLQKNDLIQNKLNIKELIIKINKKVDLISGINLLFDSKYKISSEKVKFILEELKEYYDYIIIDTSSECFFDYTKNIINNSDNVLFLLEGNLIEIKKAKKLLEMYEENWNIKKEKINLIINKYNEESIDDNIIKNIFSEYKILGKIKFNKKYNILINKNLKTKSINNDIKNEYEKITNKIIKLKKRNINLIIENIYNKFRFNLYQKNKI